MSKMDLEQLTTSLESLAETGIDKSQPVDENTRLRLLEATRKLHLQLEQPWDIMMRLLLQPAQIGVAKAGHDLGVWRALVQRDESDAGVSGGELANILGAEESMLLRVLRHAETQGYVKVDENGLYRATKGTRALESPMAPSSLFVANMWGPVFNSLPEWLGENKWREPGGLKELPASKAFGIEDQDTFSWLLERPEIVGHFNDFMMHSRTGQPIFLEKFDLGAYFSDQEGRAQFVDVAGGKGQVALAVLDKFPALSRQIYLEDLPEQLESVVKEAGGELKVQHVGCDFFEAQKVEKAKVYYLRWVLHDFPDELCIKILGRLRDVMVEDSVILIDDLVVPERAAHWYATGFDLMMMSCLAARERTRVEWQRVFDGAGLRKVSEMEYNIHGESVQVLAL